MADIIHVRREPHGAGLTRVTETHINVADPMAHSTVGHVVRYEHRETEQVDHEGNHFNGNFAAILIGGLALAILVISMVFQ